MSLVLLLPAASLPVAGVNPRQNYYPDISTALTTAESDGIGAFAAVSVHDYPLGRVFVYGGHGGVWSIQSPASAA